MATEDRFTLFYVDNDKDAIPYIIRNAPKNLRALLDEWSEIDMKMQDGEDTPEWQEVETWLADKGVEIFRAREEAYL